MASRSTDTVSPAEVSAFDSVANGDVIGDRYEILRPLGRGGSSVVYAARDRELGSDIAIKLLRWDRVSEEAMARLREEVLVARRATSPRLVRIFDLQWKDGRPFLTMELVNGGSLRDRMANGALPVDQAITIATDALLALRDLHQQAIIHRDLKPGNLLITVDGELKLADFGLARDAEPGDRSLTPSGFVPGTFEYVAPELLAHVPASRRSDLYSLGVVLYEMLTGALPTPGGTDVRRVRADIPPWLAAVVARLLENDPQGRYGSANAVLDDFASRGARRRRWPLPAAIAVVVVLVVAMAFTFLRRIPRIVSDVGVGVRAVDWNGTTLWSRKDIPAIQNVVVVRRGWWRRPLFAAVLMPPGRTLDPTLVHRLSFLDARSGRVVSTAMLPDAGENFPDFSNTFSAASLFADDFDDDGYDDVAVSYIHQPWWPSYTVVYDGRRGEARVVFVAGGHHLVAAAEDLDGDGRKELILVGINNRMGWDIGVGAVRVAFDRVPFDQSQAMTPDATWGVSSDRALLWYALAPRGRLIWNGSLTVDRQQRTVTVNYAGGRKYALTFEGFARSSASSWSPGARAVRRKSAYAHLHEALRLMAANVPDDALREIAAAESDASAAADDPLQEWVERQKGSILARAGKVEEAEDLFNTLTKASDQPGDIAYDAGHSFHLGGDLDRAIRWYRASIGRGARADVGRLKWELFEGLVFALGERQRWDEALREVDRFEKVYPEEAQLAKWYRQYVIWRSGGTPQAFDNGLSPPDIVRYWTLEFALVKGESPDRLLRRVDDALPLVSEPTPIALLRSVRAELLHRLGRDAEAARDASQAYEQLKADRATDIEARAHFDWIESRLHGPLPRRTR